MMMMMMNHEKIAGRNAVGLGHVVSGGETGNSEDAGQSSLSGESVQW
jgi:hypothetical protein